MRACAERSTADNGPARNAAGTSVGSGVEANNGASPSVSPLSCFYTCILLRRDLHRDIHELELEFILLCHESSSATWNETWGFAGVLRRFWVVPNPKIGFRPLSIHKSETNLRNRFVSNNLVWNWYYLRFRETVELLAKSNRWLFKFNAFLTMPRTQL